MLLICRWPCDYVKNSPWLPNLFVEWYSTPQLCRTYFFRIWDCNPSHSCAHWSDHPLQFSVLHWQGVVTYASPIEAFATRIKNLDQWKLFLIAPFWSSWLLDFMGVQRTKLSHASLVSKKVHWLVDISRSEFVSIPWSAPKKNADCLISFWSQSQTLLQATRMWLPPWLKSTSGSSSGSFEKMYDKSISSHNCKLPSQCGALQNTG